jgi:hypothetical protein
MALRLERQDCGARGGPKEAACGVFRSQGAGREARRSDRFVSLKSCCTGLLRPGERKSVEPIAATWRAIMGSAGTTRRTMTQPTMPGAINQCWVSCTNTSCQPYRRTALSLLGSSTCLSVFRPKKGAHSGASPCSIADEPARRTTAWRRSAYRPQQLVVETGNSDGDFLFPRRKVILGDVALALQRSMAQAAIGVNHAARLDRLLHEWNQALG